MPLYVQSDIQVKEAMYLIMFLKETFLSQAKIYGG